MRNYLYVLAQDKRNLIILCLSLLVLFLAVQPSKTSHYPGVRIQLDNSTTDSASHVVLLHSHPDQSGLQQVVNASATAVFLADQTGVSIEAHDELSDGPVMDMDEIIEAAAG